MTSTIVFTTSSSMWMEKNSGKTMLSISKKSWSMVAKLGMDNKATDTLILMDIRDKLNRFAAKRPGMANAGQVKMDKLIIEGRLAVLENVLQRATSPVLKYSQKIADRISAGPLKLVTVNKTNDSESQQVMTAGGQVMTAQEEQLVNQAAKQIAKEFDEARNLKEISTVAAKSTATAEKHREVSKHNHVPLEIDTSAKRLKVSVYQDAPRQAENDAQNKHNIKKKEQKRYEATIARLDRQWDMDLVLDERNADYAKSAKA